MKDSYDYTLELNWLGSEKSNHHREDRYYEIKIAGKEKLIGSADKPFFGDPTMYNPEDLLLSALSSCHMMSYLYLCRKEGMKIVSYQDKPAGTLKIKEGGVGYFESVILKPVVVLLDSSQTKKAAQLHAQAGKLCFIANSVNFDVSYEVTTR